MTSSAERIELPGAQLRWWPHFLAPADAERFRQVLLAEVPWRQRSIRMFGRDVREPRLTSWHGDPGARYRYCGRDHEPLPWTAALADLRDAVAATSGVGSNSVLANLYRDGGDRMGWHADDEAELGAEPAIASVSLGAVRRLQFRPRPKGPIAVSLDLPPGSLLIMAGQTQRRYHHRIAGTARPVGPRINLTFRTIRP